MKKYRASLTAQGIALMGNGIPETCRGENIL